MTRPDQPLDPARAAESGAVARAAESGVVARCATELADGVEASLAGWVERSVARVMQAWRGEVPPEVAAAAADAGRRAAAEVAPAMRELLGADIDEQRGTPLTLLRRAVTYPTAVLADAGVPPVERDAFAARAFPQDIYDLSPASWADVDPDLADAGLAWGAAKAFEHKRRHGR